MKKTQYDPSQKSLGAEKLSRIPIKIEMTTTVDKKPAWLRKKLSYNEKFNEVKQLLRENDLVTVCEEASCPNINECFSHGTATFMIMGDKCTRRCSFCAVGHGLPDPLNANEPEQLAKTVQIMKLRYVVITSVDRDDLRDGGADHFRACIDKVREFNPGIKIEILVPDFRGRMEKALDGLSSALPDVFNHNIETAPRLYKQARPGADFSWSLKLLQQFKQRFSGIPTKSGMMLGLGENDDEIREVLIALREHDVDMLTLGQYLQPTRYHLPVDRYVTPDDFKSWEQFARSIGFTHVASGPFVRSSYHADRQAAGEMIS